MNLFRDNVTQAIADLENARQVNMQKLVADRLNLQMSVFCHELVQRSEMLKTNNTLKVAKRLLKAQKDV